MTTTTDIELLQHSPQTISQEQAQDIPHLGDPSPAAVPDSTATPCHPPTGNIETQDERRRRLGRLRALSKTFGHIPNVPVLTQWDSRVDCSNSAVHRSVMAGVRGNRDAGVYSIVLSSAYMDDEDGGDVIIYTGTGGRERWTDTTPPKRIRVGPQTKDQSWEHPSNKALIVSFLTESPVRVVRSSKCLSQYAPLKGYRYDGLYKVAAYWTATGKNGKNICRCRLERLPGQPPIPVRPIAMSTSRGRGGHPLSSPSSSFSSSINAHGCSHAIGVDTGPRQTDISPAQIADTGGWLDREQQQETLETRTEVKHVPPPPAQQRISPKKSALARYRWDPKRNELIRLPVANATQSSTVVAEATEEESRADDAATLVQSEDDHSNGRIETEYFSDICGAEGHESDSPF